MTQPDALRHVLVAGGGLTGLYAAVALKRRAPFLDVTLVGTAPHPHALADRITATLPSLPAFHADLGLSDDDAVVRTQAAYRLGTSFAGWAEGLPAYAHVYGGYGRAIGPAAFHQQWLRAQRAGLAAPFDAYAPAAALARGDRFVPPSPGTPFADHGYGLTLDIARQTAMLRAFADHIGVRRIADEVVGARLDGQGAIVEAMLASGPALAADLFVDATGPAALLRTAIDDARDDWRQWLPCDRVLLADASGEEPPVLTPVVAHAAGWRWSNGVQRGVVYAADTIDDTNAAAMIDGSGDAPIPVRAGTRRDHWHRNCVAIGDAATEIEPLEWCNLHLALSAIDRLIAMLPDRRMAPVEAADFNRQSRAEAERARDFVILHYATARRPEPFWQRRVELPVSLAHTLGQFAERGRLPFYEEETFTRDSWAAVLLGQGFVPRRIDPLADTVSLADLERALAQMTTTIAAAVPHAPTHAAWRAAQTRRLAR